jgi:hypothetical protein
MLKHNLLDLSVARTFRLAGSIFLKPIMRNAIFLLSLGLLSFSLVKAEELPPDRLNIALKNARFQALPQEVQRVFVGPNGRTWFNLAEPKNDANPAAVDDISAFKKRIIREFTEKSPQFYGAELALFEPGGKVWFFLPHHCLLLGYDGNEWSEYAIPDSRDRVIGYCPTRGGCTAGRANRFTQDAVWFVCTRSILRFDGKSWSNQPLTDRPQQNPGNTLLAVSPDGRMLAACQSDVSAPPTYWLFQKGQWFSRQTQADDPHNPGGNRRLASIALSDANTLWLVYNNGQLECVKIGGEEKLEVEKNVSNLILLLADDNFAVRQRASRELMALGPSIKPQLEKTLAEQPDPEVDYRLKLILQSFLLKPAAPESLPVSEFGGVRVSFARQLFQDPAGKVGLIAENLQDAQFRQGPGVALLDDKNQAKVIFTKDHSFSGFNYQNESLPIVMDSGRRAWWPRNFVGDAVRLYDFEIDGFIDTAPMPLFGRIQAVSPEGSVFLVKLAAGNSREPIMVYIPGMP